MKVTTAANLGFVRKPWQTADALRSSMDADAAEYKHVVLDLIFLSYISVAFETKHAVPYYADLAWHLIHIVHGSEESPYKPDRQTARSGSICT